MGIISSVWTGTMVRMMERWIEINKGKNVVLDAATD